jgi:hypothetical protein
VVTVNAHYEKIGIIKHPISFIIAISIGVVASDPENNSYVYPPKFP